METAARQPAAASPLLEVNALVKRFRMRQTLGARLARRPVPIVHALNGVSFGIARGETLGIVGESGCGKSTLIRAIMCILPRAWWYVTFPGLAILITVMGFNLLGDGLRDIVDPRIRRSR